MDCFPSNHRGRFLLLTARWLYRLIQSLAFIECVCDFEAARGGIFVLFVNVCSLVNIQQKTVKKEENEQVCIFNSVVLPGVRRWMSFLSPAVRFLSSLSHSSSSSCCSFSCVFIHSCDFTLWPCLHSASLLHFTPAPPSDSSHRRQQEARLADGRERKPVFKPTTIALRRLLWNDLIRVT